MADEVDKDLEKVGHGIEEGAEDCVKVLEEVVTIDGKIEKVVDTLLADRPEIKPVLTVIFKDGVSIAGQIAAIIGEKGTKWTDNVALVAAIETYFQKDIETELVPVIEKVYGQIKADVK